MKEKPLEIHTLGRFVVKNNDKNLISDNNRLSKKWILFQFLFTNSGRPVSRERLIKILDLEKNDDPQGALTALIYRLRKTLKNGNNENNLVPYINTLGEAYIFNKKSSYWLDAERFKEICQETISLIAKGKIGAIEIFRQAISLYRGDYLEETRTEEWVWSSRSYYRELLIETMIKIDDFMQKRNLNEELWKCYEDILGVIKFEEELILGSVTALLNSGYQGLARIKYEEAVNLFRENDLQIPLALKKMGERINIIKFKDPNRIFKEISSFEDVEGALVCDPDTFTLIYDLEKRRCQRDVPPAVLVHLGFEYKNHLVSQEEYGKQMVEVLKSQFRCGDVVCRWSKDLFTLLLINIEKENVEKILERVRSFFFRDYFNSEDVDIEYRYYKI